MRFSEKIYGNTVFALTACVLLPSFGNFIASGTITPEMLAFSIPLLFYGYAFTIAVQIPDIIVDRKNNKKNFALVLGEQKSFFAILVLSISASLSFIAIPFLFKNIPDFNFFFLFSWIPLAVSSFNLLAKNKASLKTMVFVSSIMAFAAICNAFLFWKFFW
ncbi:MAG: UbiA family prenyltransferase [Candidatus Diapherotrites archaeon]